MIPKKFDGHNVVIAENQSEYAPLPAHVGDDGVVTTCWGLTLSERLKILFRGEIWHQVMTFRQPLQPQYLMTENPFAKKQ